MRRIGMRPLGVVLTLMLAGCTTSTTSFVELREQPIDAVRHVAGADYRALAECITKGGEDQTTASIGERWSVRDEPAERRARIMVAGTAGNALMELVVVQVGDDVLVESRRVAALVTPVLVRRAFALIEPCQQSQGTP